MASHPSTGPEDFAVRALPDGSDVRTLTDAEVPQVVDAVARAFHDDPFWRWVYKDAEDRTVRLARGLHAYMRRIWMPLGECYTTDRLVGGAFWTPPGRWHVPVGTQLRLFLPGLAAAGRYFPRVLRVVTKVEAVHPKDPHWYLPFIGVAPEWQGRGFGGALLRPVLERCDRDAMPAYLEASTPRSRALYERHGFEVTGEVTIADSPPIWPMWREPRR